MGGGDSASGYQTVNVHEGASQSFGVTLEDVDTIFTPFTTATAKLKERGGLDALVEALNTDVHNGVSQADVSSHFEQRKKEFVFLFFFIYCFYEKVLTVPSKGLETILFLILTLQIFLLFGGMHTKTKC